MTTPPPAILVDSDLVDSDLVDLICMADLYANKCTRQEEKFVGYQRQGITWRWVDCQAAWELLRERDDYWSLMDGWRRGEHRRWVSERAVDLC